MSDETKAYVPSSTDEERVFSSGSYTDVEEDGETSCSALRTPSDVSISNLDVARNSSALRNRRSSGELTEQQLARVGDSHSNDKPKTEFSNRGKVNIWHYNDTFQGISGNFNEFLKI